jgi:hypothetical protein
LSTKKILGEKMSENTNALVKVSVKEGLFEIAGSEDFIDKQIENLKEIIFYSVDNLAQASLVDEDIDNTEAPGPEAAPHQCADKSNPYPNVLHFEGDQVKVLKRIPGNNTSQKAVNLTLVYLWGNKRLGNDMVPFSDIRDLCKEHSCLDSANFAKHLNSARQFLIIAGKKGSSTKTCKLTLPGVEKAKEILEQNDGS